MDSNMFRNMVGLNKYCALQPDIKKLQIMYQCMQQSLANNTTWINILKDTQNFSKLNVTKNELDELLHQIYITDDINDNDNDDNDNDSNDSNDNDKQYSFQFIDRKQLENQRKQIKKSMKNNKTTRSFLMSQKQKQSKQTDIDYEEDEDEDDEEYHQQVTIQ